MSSSSEEDEPELETLNISNDVYYQAPAERKAKKQRQERQQRLRDEIRIKTLHDQAAEDDSSSVPKYGSRTIRHSSAAYDLWRPFFPTYLNEDKFRNFHRPRLRHFNTGPQALPRGRGPSREFPIKNLTKNIYKQQKRLRFKVIKAIRCGLTRDIITNNLLLISKTKDLSAKCGEIFLFEYCEEHPPVLSQVGMASNLKNYSLAVTQEQPHPKRTIAPSNLNASVSQQISCQKSASETNRMGISEKISTAKNTRKIYFSQPKPGATFQMIENNLYRAPIYEHQFPSCDFLIIRTRNNFYIRPVKTVFTVGQTMPIVAVPPPTENSIQKFRCDLSNMYVHKLFKESDTEPPTIRLDKLAKLFPDYHITSLKSRLARNGAVSVHSLKDATGQVISRGESSYGLISCFELRRLLLPEQYCLHMATLAARQRLRELNYPESMITPKNDAELETEVLAAPWNTSRAILNTLLSRNYLDLKRHLIDPTGPRREGFSCVAWSRSPTEEQQAKDMKANARAPNEAPYKYQEKNPLAHRIRTEKLERMNIYNNEASMITTVQAKVLSSEELISSSEEEDNDHDDDENKIDGDFEQQLRDLDRLVVGCRSIGELNHEKEDEERRKLLAEMRVNGSVDQDNGDQLNSSRLALTQQEHTQNQVGSLQANSALNLSALKNKILMIKRTYKTPGGEIQRTEIVREPRIIALYVKMKGGSLNSSQSAEASSPATNNMLVDGSSNRSENFTSSSKIDANQAHRPRSGSRASLGPSELCRADGVTLTISKKVLQNIRPSRSRRQSTIDYREQ